MQERVYRRNGLSNERANKYIQITNKTAAISTIASSRILHTCGDRKFDIFPFFNIPEEKISLKKSHEDYFTEKRSSFTQ